VNFDPRAFLDGRGDLKSLVEAARLIQRPGQRSVRLRLGGSISTEEWVEWERLRNSQYFLVRNRGRFGERMRCGRCSGAHVENGLTVVDATYHEFLTFACVDRPWRGLDGALWGYATITQNDRLQNTLSEMGSNLAEIHPRTYGSLASSESMDIVAIALATRDDLEDITKEKADALVERINARLPSGQKFTYEL
jgi:hypothetical protein